MKNTIPIDNSTPNPVGDALTTAVRAIIEACNKTQIEFPDLKVDIQVDDGKKYKLHFERVDVFETAQD